MAVINYKAVRRSLKSLRSQVGSAMVGFIQSGTGAVVTNVQDELRGRVSVTQFGVVGDGVTNDSAALSLAFQHGIDTGHGIYFPPGTYRVSSSITKQFPGALHLYSHGGATIQLESTIYLQGSTALTTTLSSDVARHDVSIPLTSVTGVEAGDIIRLSTSTPADAGFGYAKQCIRRVTDVSGSTVYLDQPLEWFFTTAESTVVTAIHPGRLLMHDIDMNVSLNQFMRLDGLAHSRITRCDITGPGPYNTTNTDCLIVNYSDDTIFDGCNFTDARYLPNINTGSRRTTVRNFKALRIRHIDANTWAEDTLIEHGVGIATETLVQSHPCIRTTIRYVKDMNTDAALGGLNMRGLGDVVEDCEAHSTHGNVLTDTNGIQMETDYLSMAQEFTRRITRFKSSTAGIGCRYEGKLYVEHCDVPQVVITGGTYQVGEIHFDKHTTGFTEANVTINQESSTARHFSDYDGPVHIAKLSEYGRTGGSSVLTITGITQANPGVVTSAAHGLSNGAIVRIAGVVGMTQVNNTEFKVANVAANTFELQTTAGVNVDTTGYTAYSSGGTATPQTLYTALAIRGYPAIGTYPKMHYSCKLYESTSQLGATSLAIPLKFRHDHASAIQNYRNGNIRVITRVSDATSVYNFVYRTYSGGTSIAAVGGGSVEGGTTGTATVTLTNPYPHFVTQNTAEGASTTNGDLYYFTCDLTITVGGTTRTLSAVHIEVEEWRT